jgi:hypothetical protein
MKNEKIKSIRDKKVISRVFFLVLGISLFSIIFLFSFIFLTEGVYSESATSEGERGCCFNGEEGLCSPNSLKESCEENNGEWYNDERCNIAECERKCCIVGEKIDLVTEARCSLLASRNGLNYSDIEEIFKPTSSENSCEFLDNEIKLGACVYEGLESKTCLFLSEYQCIAIGGDFNEGKLCSHSDLESSCERQAGTGCVDGKDEVYWFDSCGNRENIYDSDKDKSWNNGMILTKEESCGIGTGNSGSATCGNCNYELGTVCSKYNPLEENKPVYGENICKSMNCEFDESISGMLRNRINGESWCVYEGYLGEGFDVPGSRHRVYSCFNGKVSVEGCADYRMEVCAQKEQVVVGGVPKTEAFCRVNTWDYCINANFGKECGSECERACNSNSDCMIATLDSTGLNLSSEKKLCVPKYPPGFANDKWNEKFFGSVIQNLVLEYGPEIAMPYISEMIPGGFGKYIEGEVEGYIHDVSNAKSVSSTKICNLATTKCEGEICMYNPVFSIGVNNIGIKLGDCGSYTNLNKQVSTPTGNLILSNKLEVIGIQYAGLVAENLAFKKIYAETPEDYNNFDVPDAEPITAYAGGKYDNLIKSAGSVFSKFASEMFNQPDVIDRAQLIERSTQPGKQIHEIMYTPLIYSDSEPDDFISNLFKGVNHIVLPWRAKLFKNDCSLCSSDPYKECTKYRCESLGLSCKYKTEGEGKGYCGEEINASESSVSLKISESAIVLKENQSYFNITETSYILRKTDGSCLAPFEGVTFGIATNIEASCRIDFKDVEFENMTERFTVGGFLGKNFTKTKVLPSPRSIENNENLSELFNENGEIIFYIKCRDSKGEDEKRYSVNICVSNEDNIKPEFRIASPKNDSFISNETKLQKVIAVTSEPAECRWDTEKPETDDLEEIYDSLKNIMNCSDSVSMSDIPLSKCETELPIQRIENKFYFLCKDQPWNSENEERNIGAKDRGVYEYVLKIKTEKIKINSVKPDDENIVKKTSKISVNITTEVKNLVETGLCIYYLNGTDKEGEEILRGGEMMQIAGSGNFSARAIDLVEGEYNLNVTCTDGIYSDNKATKFTIVHEEEVFDDFIERCENISGTSKDECYMEESVSRKKIEYCTPIQGRAIKQNCYYYVAVELKDEEVCLRITDNQLKDGCYAEIAIILRNPVICNKITDEEVKERCISTSQ